MQVVQGAEAFFLEVFDTGELLYVSVVVSEYHCWHLYSLDYLGYVLEHCLCPLVGSRLVGDQAIDYKDSYGCAAKVRVDFQHA